MTDIVTDFDRFITEYWGRRPAVLRVPHSASLLSGDHYFSTAVAAADAHRAGRLTDPGDVRLLLDHGTVTPGYARRLLPRADDHDLAGQYREAPSRLHKDTADVFTLVLTGTKRIWAWPYEVLADHAPPDGRHRQVNLDIDYRDHLTEGIRLEGRPGDMLYWPAPYWHCAELDGVLHASLHLANYRDGNPIRTLRDLVDTALDSYATDNWREHRRYDHHDPATGVEELAGPLTALNRVVAELEPRWQAKWLRRVTSGNFEVVPPLRKGFDLGPADTVRLAGPYPIVLVPVDDRTDHCAANGHVFRVPHHVGVHEVVRHLNTGRETTVDRLTDLGGGAGSPAESLQSDEDDGVSTTNPLRHR